MRPRLLEFVYSAKYSITLLVENGLSGLLFLLSPNLYFIGSFVSYGIKLLL